MKIKLKFLVLFIGILSQHLTFATTIESAGSGNWNVGATWVGGIVPSAADNVTIKSSHTITVISAHSITGIVVEPNASLVLDPGSTLTSNGDITQNGTITVNGTFNLYGGTHMINVPNSFSGTGHLNIGSATVNGGNWEPSIPTIGFNGTLNGNATFKIPAGTTLTWYESGNFGLTNTITNNGTVTIYNGGQYGQTHNTASDIINNGTFNWDRTFLDENGGGQTFTNNGVFNAGGSSGTCNMIFVNNGSGIANITSGTTFNASITNQVNANFTVASGGTVTIVGNITQSGTFSINGTLNLYGGIHTINDLNSFSGTGHLNIGSATVNGGNWEPSIPTIGFNGTLNGNATFKIPAGTTLTWYESGNFGLTNTITNNGTVTIYNGGQYGQTHNTASDIINNGTFNWNRTFLDENGGGQTFTNNGVFNAGGSSGTCNMIFVNNASATVNITSTTTFSQNITNNTNASFTISAGGSVTLSGTVTQSGTFIVNGSMTLNGGTNTITAENSFSGTGTLSLGNVTMNSSGDWKPAIGNLYINGLLDGYATFTIPTGTIAHLGLGGNFGLLYTITNDGILNVNGQYGSSQPGPHNTESDIVNNGTINWHTWHFDQNGGGQTLTNNGTFNIIDQYYLQTCNLILVNTGTVNFSSTCTMSQPITNQTGATIIVATGQTVNAQSDITQSGTFTVNGILNLNGGTHVIDSTKSYSGSGSLGIGTITINSGGIWQPALGTINLAGTLTGTVTLQIPTGTTFNLGLGGNFNLSQTITNNGTMNVNGQYGSSQPGPHNTESDIVNNGTINWHTWHFDQNGGGQTLTNNGTFNITDQYYLQICNLILVNTGTVNFNSGCTLTKDITNQSTGTINVISGTVTCEGNIIQNGTFIITSTFNSGFGTIDINTANSFSGTGTLGFNYPTTINLNSAWTPTLSTINLNSAIINGTGSITVASGKTLTIGDTWFNNSTTLTNNGTFNINGGYSHNFVGDIINSATGTLNWNGGNLDGAGGFQTLTNNGIMNVTGSPTISYLDITNSGTLNTTVDCEFGATASFTNQSAGILNAQSGIAKFSNNLTNNGTLKGNGKVNISYIPFTGSGNVSPGSSPGTLSIIGDYTNTNLNIEIVYSSGVVTKDLLDVTGNVTLGGSLVVTQTGNVPSGNYVFLKTSGTITGVFSSVTIPDCYTLEYGSNELILKKGVAKIWDGTDNQWDEPLHWNPVGVPCPFDDVTINAGICELNITPDMKSLTISGGTLKKINAATYSIGVPVVVAAAGTINAFAGTLDINSTLDNNGTIQGFANIDLLNATVIGGYGKWAPGNSTGVLDAKGTYNNEVIEMEIGGNGGGVGTVELDKLNVSQTMVVGGNLDLLWLGGTIPVGTRTLMECAGGANCRTGTFANITFPAQCNGKCNIIYTGTEVRLENTEPIEFKGSCTWLGGTGNWSTVKKWSCNDVPNSNDDVIINSGNVTVDNATTVKTLVLGQDAILSGNKSLTISGALSWTGGEINIDNYVTAGTTTISGAVTLANGNLILSQGGILDNASLMLKDEAILTLSPSKILDLNYSSNIAITAIGLTTFINNGTINKLGNGNLEIFPEFLNNNELKISDGAMIFKNNLTNNNLIKGVGTMSLANANTIKMGKVAPGNSPGTLNVTGNYPNQKLIIEITQDNGVQIDKLIGTGELQLKDTLIIDHLGGSIPNGSYEFMTCPVGTNCRKNTFDVINYPAFCGGGCTIEYNESSVKLMYEQGLPVELAYFTGRLIDKEVQLDWTTLSEENAASFDIMRSANGSEWVYLGEVSANGTTSSIHDYSFTDSKPLSGENYYRLKQHDLDGSIYYTKVIRVQTPIKKAWKLYPNPLQNILEVRFSNNEDGILQIFDATGRLVLKHEIQAEKSISIDLSNLNSGLYWVQMTGFKTEMVVKY